MPRLTQEINQASKMFLIGKNTITPSHGFK
jgi:hypothetical protein